MTEAPSSLEQIFFAALEFSSQKEREKYLEVTCGDKPEIRKEVEDLLRANELSRQNEFLEQVPNLQDSSQSDPGNLPGEPTHFGLMMDATISPSQKKRFRSLPTEDQLPQEFGDYELLEKIAHGGMGVVYKARQNNLNRIVALKMILIGAMANEDEIRRFYNEAEAAAQLNHPNIVPVFDVGCHEGQHYFSMEFIPGESLADRLKRGPLPYRNAASHVLRIANAVHTAHEQGIVHRDLKPGNVLIDTGQEPKVTDFGLAKRLEGDSELTATGTIIGTPGFMPPEQANGNLHLINTQSDVYSLGAILYATLTGKAPFEGENQLETIFQVIQDEPQPPRLIDKAIPHDLQVICLKCLEKDPSLRYKSAKDLAEDLRLFLAGEPILAKADFYRRFRKWTIKEPTLAAHLAAILVMMLLIVINYFIFSGSENILNDQTFLHDQGILIGWGGFAFLMQKAINRFPDYSGYLSLLWATLNPIIATGLIYVDGDPGEPEALLYSLYFLLVITTGFLRRVDLVIATTLSSILGYLVLQLPNMGNVKESHIPVFVLAIIVAGLMQAFQVRRFQRVLENQSR